MANKGLEIWHKDTKTLLKGGGYDGFIYDR